MATHIGILPRDVLDTISRKINEADNDIPPSNFLRLPHPRTGIPSLFLPYRLSPEAKLKVKDCWGVLEVQSVAPPNPRSWLFTEGEVVADGKLLVMTPIDVSLLLLPILQALKPTKDATPRFQPLDDLFDEVIPNLCSASPVEPSSEISQQDIRTLARLDCVASSMRRVCEVKDLTPEIAVFRYSEEKTTEYLRAKVARLANLDVLERSRTIVRGLAKDGLMEDGKEALLELGRTKAACSLISQYTPAATYSALLAHYDFTALDGYLKKQQDDATAQAIASAPVAKTKATTEDDGKKRKAKASTGVQKLKKANVTGMAKMSSFFQKVV
ncbi:hypothetical protein FA95DRAFT_1675650 [Auriscalpium vulgare]|uniref:Uncharacterized protein n=1 Tax=Auriscalpium vulgare TaxID=40419 RepID=A0ACB8S6A6_9AGAM|nr:hypothetical protein FA95DRAFT_1675650 [Auriscalpium vulgare]